MSNIKNLTQVILSCLLVIISISSCVNTKSIAYFGDLKDSTIIQSKAGLEPVIQKKDILSISVSSLSTEATAVFNAPNLPITNGMSSNNTTPQTAGYLVAEDGSIKFPFLGNVQAAGLTQNQLEKNITQQLIDRKLLYDPIVTTRFLNFRVTVLGEVNRPGVIYAPSEQISILEAIGQAGDLTIYGLRNNVILIRQDGQDKLVKRLDLSSSRILQSPYFFLKSNDIIYVEPGKAKVASTNYVRQSLPLYFSGATVLIVLLNFLLK